MRAQIDIGSAIKSLETLKVPSNDLCPRILFELERRKSLNRTINLWRGFSIASSLVAIFLLMIATSNTNIVSAKMDRAYAIKIPVEKLDMSIVNKAEIKLPEGVEFFSQQYPEMKYLNEIVLEKNLLKTQSGDLPIIIKGIKKGTKVINVNYFNSESVLVDSKNIAIKFI